MNVEKVFLRNKWLALVPMVGISVYLIFFFIARASYAGGIEDYTLADHLLCDLMNTVSHNGYLNDSRYLAIIGNTFLFIGMTTFFYLIPLEFNIRSKRLAIIQVLGMIMMMNFLFLFTEYHDALVLCSGILGFGMVTLLIVEYSKLNRKPYNFYAMCCLFLSLYVFISYQFKVGTQVLPIVQKSVFLLDSIWVFASCLFIFRNRHLKVNIENHD